MRQAKKSRSETWNSISRDPGLLEDSTVVATLVVAPDGRLLAANARMRSVLGLALADELSAHTIKEFLMTPAMWTAWEQASTAPKPVTVDLRSATGTPTRLQGDLKREIAGTMPCIAGVFVDRDHEERLRDALQHSARTEALSSLTAGVAHDFNNLLTVLVGNLYLLGEELRHDAKLFEKLRAARDAGKRGSDLIKQLMAFARRESLEVGNVDPADAIGNLVPLLKRALGARITLETSFEQSPITIRANAAQLESVIVNLAVNARDAIEGRGRIAIEIRRAEIEAGDVAVYGVPKAGAYAAIAVTDTGSGIPAELIERVFEPFFSTKGERGGTGLGLSMVRWFAEQAGGSARIQSSPGKGSTVTLMLPILFEASADLGDKTMPLSTLPTGDERVVVLAADEALRTTLHETLVVLGYDVMLANDVEALLEAASVPGVRLLLIDGSSSMAAEVSARARAANGALRVIVTAEAGRSAAAAAAPYDGVLAKPFTLADLANGVRKALDG